MNLEDDEARRVQSILHLSDAEIMSITRFERGQGLISTNSNHITVSFKASPLEKQLITTDRMELNQILQEKMAKMRIMLTYENTPRMSFTLALHYA